MSVRHLSGGRVQVRVRDRASGAKASRTSVDFGDGTTVRHKVVAVHRYRKHGRFQIIVHCADKAGNRALDRVWVSAG